MVVKIPPAVESSWKDVSGGGCGFAMATSESGKLITCGSTDDLGQIYVTSGKHCSSYSFIGDSRAVSSASGGLCTES
ncbi:hypothetical protein YC2023_067287 [Brassica napus]